MPRVPINPVLRKDLIGVLRVPLVAGVQVLFVVVLATIVLLTWPRAGVVSLATQREDDLILGLMLGQLALLILAVPATAAVALTGERERGTFELLYASRLSPAQIIAGKVLAAVTLPLLLILSGLPFTAMLGYRGAVDVGALVVAYAVMIATAALLSVGCLAISAVCASSASALIASYIVILCLFGALLVPAALMLEEQSGPAAAAMHYARGLSPVAAMLSVLRPKTGMFGGRGDELLPLWRVFLTAAAAAVVACLVILVRRLARPLVVPASRGTAPATRTTLLARLARPLARRRPRRIGRRNPVFAKELRTNLLGSGSWIVRVLYAACCISVLIALMALYGGVEHPDLLNHVVRVLVLFQFAVIALLAPALTAPSISSEVELGTLEALRTTPLRATQVFWGKLAPALTPAAMAVLALLPAYAALCYVDPAYRPFILRFVPLIALSCALCCGIGLLCSSFAAATTRATAASYLLVALLFVVPAVAWWLTQDKIGNHARAWIGMPSPLVMGAAVMDRSGGGAAFADMWTPHLCLMAACCVVVAAAAQWRLARLMGRGC
jgi:ABC-type transport system involved in multi-copper enzyme maturation permease subunit